jgi:GTP-binding protein
VTTPEDEPHNDSNPATPEAPPATPQAATPWEIKEVTFEKSGSRRTHFPREPRLPQVAFVGRSNVGKSSLLNVLVNRKRMAHVSRTPGRTQLVNFFIVNGNIRLVDLPGYGFAKAPKEVKVQWDQMITGYLLKNRDLKLVVTLFDMRRDPTPEDETLLDWLKHYEIPFMAVLTKADKLNRSDQAQKKRQMEKWLENWGPTDVLLFSALSRAGRQEILDAIGTHLTTE